MEGARDRAGADRAKSESGNRSAARSGSGRGNQEDEVGIMQRGSNYRRNDFSVGRGSSRAGATLLILSFRGPSGSPANPVLVCWGGAPRNLGSDLIRNQDPSRFARDDICFSGRSGAAQAAPLRNPILRLLN